MIWLIVLGIVVLIHQTTTKSSGVNVYAGRAHESVLVVAGGFVVLAFLWALITSFGG